VLVVNQSMARRYWPDGQAVGKQLLLGGQAPFQVVGVVADVRHNGLAASEAAAIYVPHSYFPRANVNLFVRTASEPLSMVRAITGAIRELDREQPIADVATMDQVISRTIANPRLLSWLLAGFAGVALALAAIGLYGVISYVVGQRRKEIGVRIALGARRADVVGMVVRDGMTLAALGVALGLIGSAAATRALASQLFGVTTTDAATFVSVPLVLIVTALIACLAPAARAARTDPMVALRTE
jgi:ABC-type antimicrobial peptide transport system permease subunit